GGWYAVFTRPRGEHLAALSIRSAGHQVFLPMARKEPPPFGSRRRRVRPLFSRYLFARFGLPDLDSVRYARGVVRILGRTGAPVEVGAHLVEGIQGKLSPEGYFEIREAPVRAGDFVRINGGPFDGMLGRVQREFDDGKRVALLLESLEQAQVVVEKRFIRAAAGA
ncbi:MAG TPA: transcription termination/antitermination NusG family protein, partial [Verrucomicrobiales bacterium]|nr:transcription termination/antitermination NusG family protein [Verrucomicrobiales bacterium]